MRRSAGDPSHTRGDRRARDLPRSRRDRLRRRRARSLASCPQRLNTTTAPQGGREIPRRTDVERGGESTPARAPKGMTFDLICRGCGACAQRNWDPTEAVSATLCPACDASMSVIGIDFPAGREQVGLTRVLEVIQGAGIVPIAVERRGGRPLPAAPARSPPPPVPLHVDWARLAACWCWVGR